MASCAASATICCRRLARNGSAETNSASARCCRKVAKPVSISLGTLALRTSNFRPSVRAASSTSLNVRADARGMAQMMRAGLYRPVHVKTLRSQKLRMLLTHRKLLQSKAIAIENELRASLRNFGLKVGMVGTMKFEARIRELVERLPDLAVLVE